jgi:hypothetical protein
MNASAICNSSWLTPFDDRSATLNALKAFRSMIALDVKRRVFVILILGLPAGACGPAADRPPPAPQRVVAWRAVGSWSGHGNKQTESFTSESGALRVRWTTTADTPSPGTAAAFRVTAHSAISGRLLESVVDQAGAGSGVGYVNQDPHVFYLMVESDHLDWTLSVEEAVAATVSGR